MWPCEELATCLGCDSVFTLQQPYVHEVGIEMRWIGKSTRKQDVYHIINDLMEQVLELVPN